MNDLFTVLTLPASAMDSDEPQQALLFLASLIAHREKVSEEEWVFVTHEDLRLGIQRRDGLLIEVTGNWFEYHPAQWPLRLRFRLSPYPPRADSGAAFPRSVAEMSVLCDSSPVEFFDEFAQFLEDAFNDYAAAENWLKFENEVHAFLLGVRDRLRIAGQGKDLPYNGGFRIAGDNWRCFVNADSTVNVTIKQLDYWVADKILVVLAEAKKAKGTKTTSNETPLDFDDD